MYDVLNDFYEENSKYSEDKILKNCKDFLSYRAISPDFKILGISPKYKKYPNSRKNDIRFINKTHSKLKPVSLSSLNLLKSDINKCYYKNRRNNDFFLKNNFKSNSVLVTKYSIKPKLENELIRELNNKSENNILKNFEKIQNPILSRIQSSKIIINNKDQDINSKIIKNKVNKIIKNLLTNKSPKLISNSTTKNLYPLNLSIDPMKYIELNMINEPNNKNIFKSYDKQVKYFIDKKVRNYLIEGVNDYKENIQKYNKIYFDHFSINNNFERKINQNKIKKILLREKYYDINKSKNKNKSHNISYNSFKLNYEKFKNDYIKEYRERKGNIINNDDNNKGMINNDKKYFRFFNNNNFYKMMSIDGKLKEYYISAKNVTKNMKSDILKKLRRKYMF